MKYKVGDKVKIVKNRTPFMNFEGEMDCYLDSIMTITKVVSGNYSMKEDNGKWAWIDSMIEELVGGNKQMKTINRDELKKIGLKEGDIINLMPFRSWGMVTNETNCQSINALNEGFGFESSAIMLDNISHIIFKKDWQNVHPNKIVALFQGFDNYSSFPVFKITDVRMSKYVHAVHFGSSKLYTWRVPTRLQKVNFKIGDIVEVQTIHGNQYVQVKETAEYEYDYKTKEVISLIKATDLPF